MPAMHPDDLTRLFVEAVNARDAEALAALYAPDAVMSYPAGRTTVGRDAIRELWTGIFASMPAEVPPTRQERQVPTVVRGGLALTATIAQDGTGARAQVAERQPDGTWLRILDQPEFLPRA